MSPSSLQSVAVGALSGAAVLTVVLYRSVRTADSTDWTNWRLVPLLIATPLLTVGIVATRPARPASVLVAGFELPSATRTTLGTGSVVVALSLSIVASCWLFGSFLVVRARALRRAIWWL